MEANRLKILGIALFGAVLIYTGAAEASTDSSPKLFVMKEKSGMGVLAKREGNKISLTYNYRIRYENQQAVWKHVHDLQTREEYVCNSKRECVNTKHEELKLILSKDGQSIRVVGPAELIDYRFEAFRGPVVQVDSLALNQ